MKLEGAGVGCYQTVMLPVLYLGSDLQLNKSDKDHVFIGHKKVLSRLFKQSEHQSKQKAASNRCLFVSGT